MRGIFLDKGLLLAVAAHRSSLAEVLSALATVGGFQDLSSGGCLGQRCQHCLTEYRMRSI